jgi:hypothetical protein
MKISKRILSVLIVLALTLTCLPLAALADGADTTTQETTTEETQTPSTGETDVEEEDETPVITEEQAFSQMTLGYKDGDLELYYHEGEFLNFAVKNTKTGDIWFTNPPNALGETREKGLPKTTLASQLYVTMIDNTTKSFFANSQVACYKKGTCEVKITDEGILVTYDFQRPSESFTIPVLYTVKGGSFKATVKTKEIVEYGNNRIITIELLPHFGAGGLEDQGYMLIPDGSGAIIEFNNGNGDRSSFTKEIYGGDQSYQPEIMPNKTEEITMPVFGIVNNGKGYVATVTGSDGAISAAPSSKSATYNHAYASFNYRKKGSYQTKEGTHIAKEQIIIGQFPANYQDFTVEYMFLESDDVSYSGMARRYRQYLMDNKGFEKKTNSFTENLPTFLEIYGELPRETSFLGIPVTKYETLSSYSEVADIIKDLGSKGVNNLVIDYVGWQKNGPNTKVPTKLSYSSKLGGKKGYEELLAVAQEYGAKVFPRVEFVNITQGGNGYLQASLTAKSTLRTPIQHFLYHLGSGMRIKKASPNYFLKTQLYDEIVDKYLKTSSKLGLNTLAVESLANVIYNDFETKKLYDTNEYRDTVTKQLEKITQTQSVLAKAPNDYALGYTDYITSLASFSSDYLVCSYEVPFMQIVLHGYIPYSNESISAAYNTREAFLKTIETGSSLLFTITANSARVMKDSPHYNFLYCSEYDLWNETAQDFYKELNSVLGPLQQVEIKDHQRVAYEVYTVTYANGTQITVNYNDTPVTVGETVIEALSYNVVKGGAQ